MAFGSFQNAVAGTDPALTPTVGMGATYIMWTDREPYTVVAILSPTRIVVQEDHAKRTDANGMSECQSYVFSPNPEGAKRTLSKRRNGQWVPVGETTRGGSKFKLGTRSRYHDYSF